MVTYSQDILDMFVKSEGIRKGNTKQLDWHNLLDSRYMAEGNKDRAEGLWKTISLVLSTLIIIALSAAIEQC